MVAAELDVVPTTIHIVRIISTLQRAHIRRATQTRPAGVANLVPGLVAPARHNIGIANGLTHLPVSMHASRVVGHTSWKRVDTMVWARSLTYPLTYGRGSLV